ncbi:MAG: chemotaxis protein CheW [Nitrospirota bacterium]|nr:chemotaxis protein CheW [Nitrospirota bacterium]
MSTEGAQNEPEEEIERDQYLVFKIKSQEYGLKAMLIQEISAMFDIKEVPNAPAYIDGIMNLRGRLVSIINFRKKFGFEAKEHDEETRIVYVEHEGFPIGIIVDSVEEVIRITDDKMQKLPETAITTMSEKYIEGVGMLDERLIIVLDAKKVLDKADVAGIGAADMQGAGQPAGEQAAA